MTIKRMVYLIYLTCVLWMVSGCTQKNTYPKLTGLWDGQNTNSATGQKWNFTLTIEHRGSDIAGIYTDYRGSRTLRNVTYNGEVFGFIIDLWPESVTYYGIVDSNTSISGTWSFSGDDNNGSWYLLKNRDPEESQPETNTTGAMSSQDFQRHL